MASTEQQCLDAIHRIQARIQAVQDSPEQVEHHRQLIRDKAYWISQLNKVRRKTMSDFARDLPEVK